MASKDSVYDLLDNIKENDMDYLLITVDKGTEANQIELYYDSTTVESEQAMIYSFYKMLEQIHSDKNPDGKLIKLDYGTVSQDEMDEYFKIEEDDEDEEI
jgi:hypothetical protein